VASAPVSDPTGAPVRGPVLRAVLTVGAVETEYLRCGAGRPVLVLSPALAAAIEAGAVPPTLRDVRLIVPMHTSIDALASPRDATQSVLAVWLRGMIDGLGLGGLTVVATPALAAEVRRFAEANPSEAVAVVVDG
jgi:hypothetical protein